MTIVQLDSYKNCPRLGTQAATQQLEEQLLARKKILERRKAEILKEIEEIRMGGGQSDFQGLTDLVAGGNHY